MTRLRTNRVVSALKHSGVQALTLLYAADYAISLGFSLTLAVLALMPTAAAQIGVDQASNAICGIQGVNVGAGITLLAGAFSLYFILKFMYRFGMGMDKGGSNQQKTVQSGNQMVRGSGKSLVGALSPMIVIAFLEAINISVTSCLIPGT